MFTLSVASVPSVGPVLQATFDIRVQWPRYFQTANTCSLAALLTTVCVYMFIGLIVDKRKIHVYWSHYCQTANTCSLVTLLSNSKYMFIGHIIVKQQIHVHWPHC